MEDLRPTTWLHTAPPLQVRIAIKDDDRLPYKVQVRENSKKEWSTTCSYPTQVAAVHHFDKIVINARSQEYEAAPSENPEPPDLPAA